jgi:hypothetical protein
MGLVDPAKGISIRWGHFMQRQDAVLPVRRLTG